MARVRIELPTLLATMIGGERMVEIEADTVSRAFAALFAARPALRVHLVDERGGLRPHVLCFVNDRDVRWIETALLHDGDILRFTQAVSGG
jgi:hypothetical protein